ncbi:DnaJ C-terminal domain-containing protein [Thalassobaculum sp. OXR-137]|uniref:DnaJ C-terminal domain-containing protein n=1 Tax=Thalassobaculum sp. OXR-137 TaxID=3100173 RepID=UPI002AC97437|nr:DnaJ C-terminal domain-containing protein [Thalassobaculum sp. OXR-137]WPZ32379.1 DnaJ C-terminal domain-containing protein [Thalassobaculum sp. OXR-137]
MSDDPYAVLGVPKTASDAEIRKAYRKLAKELHPDLNPGDAGAEERFKRVSAAYSLLGDAEKRARFDRGEIDASGMERPEQPSYRHYADSDPSGRYHNTAGYEDFADMSDLFRDLFEQERRRCGGHGRGHDVRYHLTVDFLDAVRGAKRRITMPDGNALDLTIPAGTKDGALLRLRGKGGPGFGGGPSGDALVEVAVAPHPVFERHGADIHMDLAITLDEAVLGGKVKVPTPTGRVNMTVPKGTSSGHILRLKGKGVAAPGTPPGDQLVRLTVVLPKQIDPELEAFMRDWRTRHAYDPRSGKGRAA